MTPNMRTMLMSNDPQAIVAFLSAEDFTRSLEDVLPTMKMPCLVYAGDAGASHSNVKKCVKSMPNATFVSLRVFNHIESERVDIMLPHITKFLEKIRQP